MGADVVKRKLPEVVKLVAKGGVSISLPIPLALPPVPSVADPMSSIGEDSVVAMVEEAPE